MMIAIDTSELAEGSRLPPIPNAKTSDILERETGADFLISPLGMPVTEKLLPKHLDAGAVLINRKSGADMLSSIASGSINAILARMIAAGARWTWQRIIMSTGLFAPDLETGKALVGEPRKSKQHDTYVHLRQTPVGLPGYKAFATIRRRIALRGGYYLPLTCDDEIPGELAAWEEDLRDLAKIKNKIKEVWPKSAKMFAPPSQDDPLQEPVLIDDWRVILAQFDGVGPARATALRDDMLKTGADDTFINALCWATWSKWKELGKIKHWGAKTFQSVRDEAGVPDGFDIELRATREE